MTLQSGLTWIYGSISPVLSYRIGNTTSGQLLAAFIVFLVSFVVLEIFRTVILHKLGELAKKTRSGFDDEVVRALRKTGRPLYLAVSAYLAARFVITNETALKAIGYALLVIFTYYVVKVVQTLVNYFAMKEIGKRSREGEEAQAASITRLVTRAISVGLWAIAALFLLSNFGFDITSLVAGLGIGGLAVALALQGVFGDLFATLSIYFDKPFKVGDFIIIGQDMGTVDYIGLKSTRIKTLQGQQLTISNKELTNSRINNYARMETRRISFTFGIEYDTKIEKTKKIPVLIKELFEKVKMTRLDRVHLKEFGPYSLNYEVVYYVLSPDYNKYMDCQQEINLAIKEAFEKEGIKFAYPTQIIHVNR